MRISDWSSDVCSSDLEFVALQKTFAGSPKSWTVDAAGINQSSFDLSVKNPDGGEAVVHRSPKEILDETAAMDAKSAAVLAERKSVVSGKRVSVPVSHCGRRILKKKDKKHYTKH